MEKKPVEQIDPANISKGGGLRRKGVSVLTVILLIFLAASFWIFLVSVEMAPNPFFGRLLESAISFRSGIV